MTGKKSLNEHKRVSRASDTSIPVSGDAALSPHRAHARVGVLSGKRTTHPNRFRNPNVSTTTPMNGHLRNTSTMPPRKHKVPRSLFLRAKK